MIFTSYLDAAARASEPTILSMPLAPDRPLRALVRGTGSIGARHLRVLASLGFSQLFAWPVRPTASLAGREDLPRDVILVDGYPEEQLDLVIIATDTLRHVSDTLQALEHSPRCILLEKPVAVDADSAAVLAAHPLADRISVSAPLRFHQGFVVLSALLPRLGTVSSAAVRSQSWLPSWRPQRDYRQSYSARREEGGVLRDLVHDIDYPLALFGQPSSLQARLSNGILDIEAEEAADILWTGSSQLQLRLDYVSVLKKRSISIMTESAELIWDVVNHRVDLSWPTSEQQEAGSASVLFSADSDVDTILARQSLSILARHGVIPAQLPAGLSPASLQDGCLAVAICDAARASSATGASQQLTKVS